MVLHRPVEPARIIGHLVYQDPRRPVNAGFPPNLVFPSRTADGQQVTRLAIEFVSGICQASGGLAAQLFTSTSGNANGLVSTYNSFPLNPTPTGGWYEFSRRRALTPILERPSAPISTTLAQRRTTCAPCK
jgi:hypothetical protein